MVERINFRFEENFFLYCKLNMKIIKNKHYLIAHVKKKLTRSTFKKSHKCLFYGKLIPKQTHVYITGRVQSVRF